MEIEQRATGRAENDHNTETRTHQQRELDPTQPTRARQFVGLVAFDALELGARPGLAHLDRAVSATARNA